MCFATARFIAHLFNQQVVTDLLLLEFLSTCTLDPSDGSIELAVVTLQECTSLLSEKSPRPLELIFQRLRQVLHDGDLSRRVQVMIEDLIAMRRKTLSSEATLDPRLDLLDEEDIITHLASLDDEQERDLELECDGFQFDPDFEENERIYELIKRDILGAEADAPDFLLPFSPGNSNVSSKGKDGESDAQTSALAVPGGTHSKDSQDTVKDMTESESLEFRRTVYLTITSGLSSEEWAHKLIILMRKYPGRELDLCQVIIECCSQEKTFLRPYGLLGQRFCMMDEIYVSKFEELFATHYATIHQFKVRKILNMANFYSFLFACDSLPWSTFQIVRIVESETTQSSRIFLKQLLRELAKTMGKTRLKEHFADHSTRGNLLGLLPTDCAENAKYAIRFFKNIELEYLAEELEGILSTLPNLTQPDDDGGDDSSVSSSVSSDSASSSSLSESSGIGDGDAGSVVFGRAASVGSGGRDVHQQPLRGAASESMSKRGAEESSLDHSHRPAKLRRRTVGDPEPSEDTRTAAAAVGGGGGGATVGTLRRGDDISSDRRRKSNEEGPFNRDNDNTHSRQSGGSKPASRYHGSGATGTGTGAGNVLAVVGPRVRDDDSDSDMEEKRNRLRDRERRRGDSYGSGSGGGSSGTNNKNVDNEKKYGVRRRHKTSSRSRRGYMDDDLDDDDNDMVISRRSNHRVKSSSKHRDKKERRSHSHSHSRSHSHSYHDDGDGSSQSDADYHSNEDGYIRRRPSDQRMRDRDRDRSRRYVDVSYDEPAYGSDRRDSRGRREDGVGSKRRSRKKDYARSSSRRIPKGRDRGRDRDMALSDSEDDHLSLRSRSRSRSRSPSRSSRSRSRSDSRSMSRSRSVSVSPQRRSSRRYYSRGGSGSGSGTGGGSGGGGGSAMDRYGRRPSERGEQASG